MKLKKKNGFTIVELVIVIAIIAILAAVLIPTFTTVIDKAECSAALQDAKNAVQVVSGERNGVMGNLNIASGKYVFFYKDGEGMLDSYIKCSSEKNAIYTAVNGNTGGAQQHSLQCIYYYRGGKDWKGITTVTSISDDDKLKMTKENNDIPPKVLVVTVAGLATEELQAPAETKE